MEEKAAEGNVAYFAEFPGDVLDAKLAGDAAWSADYLRFSWDFVRLS